MRETDGTACDKLHNKMRAHNFMLYSNNSQTLGRSLQVCANKPTKGECTNAKPKTIEDVCDK